MQGCVAFEVSLQQLFLEDAPPEKSLQALEGVVLRGDVEVGLVLDVAQIKVLFAGSEVLHHHLVVVSSNGVVDRQVPIVVFGIELGSDVLHNAGLSFNTDDVLHSLAFVILLSPRSEEVIGPCEPVEEVNVTQSSADEEHVLPKVVLNHDGSRLPGLENAHEVKTSLLACYKEWRPTQEVWDHAKLTLVVKDLLGSFDVLLHACHVQDGVTVDCVFGAEINLGSVLGEQFVKHSLSPMLDREEQWRLTIYVSQI